MSEPQQQLSERRVMWWARSFSRPLQAKFAAENEKTPDDLRALLEMADDRQAASGKSPREA